ncbi:hypothetical protein GL270_21695 [Aeromonas veronii]|uniref:hypothetical protein n=1 Tax=Aeromonas veronii TaxID=654 RepID=UPI001C5AB124|nr:hypothetical protein [Aeromonas veronii]MBW3783811.1 hypothetical protein [Aeromonas veronii]
MLTRFDRLRFVIHPMAQDLADLGKDYEDIAEQMAKMGVTPDDFGHQAIEECGELHLSVVRGKYWGPGYMAMITRLDNGHVVAAGERLSPEEVDSLMAWMEDQR